MWVLHPLVLLCQLYSLQVLHHLSMWYPFQALLHLIVCLWHLSLPLIHLIPLRNPQKMSLVSHLQFIQFKGMVKDRVRSFLDVSRDLEIRVDLEAELVEVEVWEIEVEVWEVDVEGMLHFCCWFICFSSSSIKC